MTHPQDLSLRQQASAIAAGELDPGSLLEATFDRIEERDGPLNSIVARFPEQARSMLEQAPRGPLYGVPVAVKDMFRLPWYGPRDGAPREQMPPGESAMYTRLRDAGAVIVGIANMHFWGGGTTGHLSAYGPVGNPWNADHCGGGSSGGSASAVGARLVAAAVGDDGGGSVRLPAAYCGITGLKLTYGQIPVDGFTHGYSNMCAQGPMCRDAGDARLFGEAMVGSALPASDGARLRVGIVRSFWDDLDPEVEQACRDALAATGWETEEIELPATDHVLIATVLRLTIEGLPEITEADLADADPLTRALVKYQLLLSANAFSRADRVRAELRRGAADAFDRCDVLVWPTVPAPAPPIEAPVVQLPSGPAPPDAANVRQTGFGNLTGIPGISVPVGTHSSGLPMGLQLQAAWGRDAVCLDAAEHLERATERQFVDAVPPLAAAPA